MMENNVSMIPPLFVEDLQLSTKQKLSVVLIQKAVLWAELTPCLSFTLQIANH